MNAAMKSGWPRQALIHKQLVAATLKDRAYQKLRDFKDPFDIFWPFISRKDPESGFCLFTFSRKTNI